jgi:hypothetical protein
MKLKRELENRVKKSIHELGIGHTFIYEGMLYLLVSVPETNSDFQQILNRNYRLAVNLQDNMLTHIRIDVEVVPVKAEILSE